MDFEKYYKEIARLKITSEAGEEMRGHCPFHDDRAASFSVNKQSGLWKCFGACQTGGNVYQFHIKQRLLESNENLTLDQAKKEIMIALGEYKTIPFEVAENYHKQLLENHKLLDFLINERGLTIETIKAAKLGCDDERICIPIADEDGYLVNIRKYKPHATEYKVISYDSGYGQARLYPIDNLLKHEDILLTEGEMDCLLANQLGYHAVTGTTGAGKLKQDLPSWFKDKNVYICYDIDEAGKKGAEAVSQQLCAYAKKVYIIKLPITTPDNGDFTDFFITHKKSKAEFDALIQQAEPLKICQSSAIEVADPTVYDVILNEAAKKDYYYKRIKMRVVVSGKDLAPYFAPKKLQLKCEMGLKQCQFCPLAHNGGTMEIEFSLEHSEILQLINCDEAKQVALIRQKAQLPRCFRFETDVKEVISIEEIRVIPEIDYSIQDADYVTRQIFYLGYGLKPNRSYLMHGITIPDPNTQYATQLISQAEPTQSSIDQFQMTPEVLEKLKIFQTDNIKEKIKEINDDLTFNVTKIYGREDLITAVDLIYHSALHFVFQGRSVPRGWCDGLIIGDTRCGKTESLIRLIQHYRLGELCTGENISYAGLVGGMSQAQQRWSIAWGKIPLNDRRLVVLDEVSSLDVDTISNLSALRSSGIAEIIKIQTERTNARTRLIWVSNPRSGRRMDTYNYGVLAVKELIGRVEDVARFDFAISIATDEVPMEQINATIQQAKEHKYTADLCNLLILWAWSRKPENIKFTPEAVQTILDKAMLLGEKYSSAIPLVEGAEERIKLAKLSVAIAARTFSTEDGENLIVKPEHVEFIYEFLDRIFSKPSMGYDVFSKAQKQALLLDKDRVKELEKEFKDFDSWKLLRSLLLEYQGFRRTELSEQMGYDSESCRLLFKWMTLNKFIKTSPIGYVKQPIFTAFLKNMNMAESKGGSSGFKI